VLDKDTPACRAAPRDLDAAAGLVTEPLRYFADKRLLWTAAAFEPGSPITDDDSYRNTLLTRCGSAEKPRLPGQARVSS
jgi:hypothetical protein